MKRFSAKLFGKKSEKHPEKSANQLFDRDGSHARRRVKSTVGRQERHPMEGYNPIDSYQTAENYDQFHVRGDEQDTVNFLKELANGGSALELAIGTGRIALPLFECGITVDGIDFSKAMVEKLKCKKNGNKLNVIVDDYKNVNICKKYNLIYIVFNTLFNLLTQDEQIECFENVSNHLLEGGCFVVEGGMPTEFCNLPNNQYVRLEGLTMKKAYLDVAIYDPVSQILDETHIGLSSEGTRLGQIVTRYAWPSELDLMAKIAGLKLVNRYSDWKKSPMKSNSSNCISVYKKIIAQPVYAPEPSAR
ncbi:MAG: class I SAM-dependent methyltransferase [bacterium]